MSDTESVVHPITDPDVLALEALLTARRRASALLLSLDGYERWGQGTDPAFEREAAAAAPARDAATEALTARVPALRAQRPAAVIAWAEAHLDLLDHYLATAPEERSVERWIATEERAAWVEVQRGARAYVAENTAFQHWDPARYAARFQAR